MSACRARSAAINIFVASADCSSRDALAAELERIAAAVRALPGVSRRKPEAFLEAKSELAGRMIRRAAELRAEMEPAA